MGGINLHAKVAIGARHHPRRERLCRYLLRPPLAQDRLALEPDGRVRLAFKAAWKGGTHAVLLDPLDLMARLCALVPPPRSHMCPTCDRFARRLAKPLRSTPSSRSPDLGGTWNGPFTGPWKFRFLCSP